jgi:serine protease Do
MLATTHTSQGILIVGDSLMLRIGKRLQLELQHAGLAVLLLIVAPLASFMQVAPTKTTTDITPQALSDSFAEVAKLVEPAVVSIDTKGKVPDISAKGDNSAGDSNDIMEFFRRQMARRPVYAVGSGFIVDKSGYILTNLHVVEEAARITVKLDSGEEFQAKVVGSDDETDLAVLKIDAGRELPFVKLGNSDQARVGEWVLAIGSPFGLTRTVTAGIVSQTKRETPQGSAFQKFIQTDAAINKGNSGGPLVNMKGEVIGVNSQIATSTGDYNGVGFALPSNDASNVLQQIVKNGKVRRGYLGVNLESVKPEFAKVYNLSDTGGAIVTDLRDKLSPAGRAGLQVGDVIVEFGGKKVQDAGDLITRVSAASPDETIALVYLRETGPSLERKTTQIRLAERQIENRASVPVSDRRKLGPEAQRPTGDPFGLTLSDLTPTLASSYKLEGQRGVVVKEVNPESYIADVKVSNGSEAFSEGDLIRRINRAAVTDMKTFNAAIAKLKPGDAVVMEVISYSPAGRTPQLKIVQFTVQ